MVNVLFIARTFSASYCNSCVVSVSAESAGGSLQVEGLAVSGWIGCS